MPGWVWSLGMAAAIAGIALALLAAGRRRTARLRRQFGAEYDRVFDGLDVGRDGEVQLQERARRRARLNIVPLPEEVREAYRLHWRLAQEGFVDRPEEAVATAELLLHRVMAEQGYPVVSYAEQADLLSVDHPDVVEDYRVAHEIRRRQASGRVTANDLREALPRYRSIFESLLSGGDRVPAEDLRLGPQRYRTLFRRLLSLWVVTWATLWVVTWTVRPADGVAGCRHGILGRRCSRVWVPDRGVP
jgi:hypothetical protein